MNVNRPEDFHQSYVDAFNSGDVASVVGLYERDARFVPQPNQVASGHAAIGEALRRFQAMGTMAAETRYCVTSGDVALASASWQIKGIGPDGQPVDLQGASADLLRRQADDRWLLVVDHPFGGA
ncbi:MAG: YybH family protein [Thermomicrobiales bacterium]